MARKWHYSNHCNTAGNPGLKTSEFHKMFSVDIYLVCEVDGDHLTAEEAGGGRGVAGVRLWDVAWGPRSWPSHPHPPALDNAIHEDLDVFVLCLCLPG